MLITMTYRIIGLTLLVFACQQPEGKTGTSTGTPDPLFELLSTEQSGIDFLNQLQEDSTVNYFTYPYIYMGGGVAVGDLNNDGLQDLYFTGNMVDNKLYLNTGELTFKDITDQAKVTGEGRWSTGVTMVDINADGWLDIYVSVSGKFTSSNNLLYLNQGVDDQGMPVFEEMAEVMGIADSGRTTQATFFDYDKDGDLDLYLANYPFTSFKTSNNTYRRLMDLKNPEHSDKLYRNTGNGAFEDVTEISGILNFGLALGIVTGDFNHDGWDDIYVSNDFATPDFFYFNNGDGTFSEKIRETTKHTAFFGMGIDAGDLNNDGLLDLVQMDMTPEDNFRNKANMASMNPPAFYEMVNLGLHFQYMQNAVQLNQGVLEKGYPHFSDIARITGMATTDWSWAGLCADLNNDGWKDVFVTNGTRKDINNKDYFKKIDKATPAQREKFDYVKLSKEIPHDRINNYVFRNDGDLNFTSIIEDWGLGFEGFSNGAAYADLDNDGDLEIVVNNIDDPSQIFKNYTVERGKGHYLRIDLIGSADNPLGLGAVVTIKTPEGKQLHSHTLTRGFQSSTEPFIHFGLGSQTRIEEVEVSWPDGRWQIINHVAADQVLKVLHSNAIDSAPGKKNTESKLFAEVSDQIGLDHLHQENPYNDFAYEVLLPHVYSQFGPALAVGDINSDGLDDFFVGGSAGFPAAIYHQQTDGTFDSLSSGPWLEHQVYEDIGAAFFDADGDGDQDLYVVSGGNEFPLGSTQLQDRLYLNNGSGGFVYSEASLPPMLTSGSRVRPADFDQDGDMDLFVGGRVKPRTYPQPAKSYILLNEGNEEGTPKFVDATSQLAPELEQAGLVTDAGWVDYDQDDLLDLIVVGEWMPLTFFKNTGNVFENKTEEYGLSKTTGWWYSIISKDFDSDGDQDLMAGNLGLNYKYQASLEESFDVYAYDYDKNGNLDIVLGYYEDGVQYPVRGRQCSSQQIPVISIKYEDYNSFANATLSEIYSDQDLEASLHYQAHTFASSYIENQGNGRFEVRPLPNQVQLSSINAMVPGDFNGDGHLDVLAAGNLYGAEVETTRNDAGYGNLLVGDGNGNFEAVPYQNSGIYLPHDTKNMSKLQTTYGPLIVVANNQDYIKILKPNAVAVP